MTDIVLALCSGAAGALMAQCLAILHTHRLEKQRQDLMRQLEEERRALRRQLETERQAFEISQAKLAVLRKFTCNRGGIGNLPISEHTTAFFEALNEIMVAFSGSPEVVKALNDFRIAQRHKRNDHLVSLFKAMCRDVGVDLSAFNDSLFLEPFSPSNST